MVDIGKLRHRIEIQKPTKTADDAGGFSAVWATYGSRWAEMLVPRFNQQVIQGGVQTSEQVQARLRKGHGAVIGDRVVWDNGSVYTVVAVDFSRTDEDYLGLKLVKKRGA